MWTLDWLIPVHGKVEQNTLWRIDLSGVTEPTEEDREETARFEDQEAVLAGGVPYKPA